MDQENSGNHIAGRDRHLRHLPAWRRAIWERHFRWERNWVKGQKTLPQGHTETIRNWLKAAASERGGTLGLAADVGGGLGHWGEVLRPFVSSYVVFDLAGIEPADLAPNTSFVRASADCLPLAVGRAEVAVSFEMLEHCPYPGAILREIHRILAPGSTLILSTRQYWRTHGSPNDYFRYTKFGLARLLEDAGFTVKDSIPMGGPVALALLAINLEFTVLDKPFVKQCVANPLWSAAAWIDERLSARNESDFDTAGWLIRARS